MLADLRQPALLPLLAEPADDPHEARLGAPAARLHLLGRPGRRNHGLVHVAVQDADGHALERGVVMAQRVAHAAGDRGGDELALEGRHLRGEVRAIALPEQLVLAGLEVHLEVGRKRDRLRGGGGLGNGHVRLL